MNKEIMKQALDALEATWPKRSSYISAEAQKEAWTKHEAAIEALRAAIAQGESEPVGCKGKNCGSTKPILHSSECFAEHEACVNPDHAPFGYFEYVLDDGDGYWREIESGTEGKPLYDHAAPQVADYVPLSDARIDDITKKTWPGVSDVVMPAYLAAYRGYARSIERAVRGVK